MKRVIDLEGNEIDVSDDTPVRTTTVHEEQSIKVGVDSGGKDVFATKMVAVSRHFLLSNDEKAQMQRREDEWQAGKKDRQFDEIRRIRRGLLVEADIAIMRIEDDGGNPSKWRQYRKALRNITSISDPFAIRWPNKPE